jgi:hypothetical protein
MRERDLGTGYAELSVRPASRAADEGLQRVFSGHLGLAGLGALGAALHAFLAGLVLVGVLLALGLAGLADVHAQGGQRGRTSIRRRRG